MLSPLIVILRMVTNASQTYAPPALHHWLPVIETELQLFRQPCVCVLTEKLKSSPSTF